jgi:GR25 family glycosyltransferase involved in LPS biosynthesis
MSSLKESLEMILGGGVEINIIHLKMSVDRVESINMLENKINSKLTIVEAVDGKLHKEHCRACPFSSFCWVCKNHAISNELHLRSYGEIGCLLSHLKIWKSFVETPNNYNYCVIFEDDCNFLGDLNDINNILSRNENVLRTADIILLGALTYVKNEHVINNDLSKIKVFDGTHAMIITKETCQKCIEFYKETTEQGYLYPADAFYASARKKYDLNIVGLNQNIFFAQDRTIKSTIANS